MTTANDLYPTLLSPSGGRLFRGNVGASPWNAGTAAGMPPDYSKDDGGFGNWFSAMWTKKHGLKDADPFASPLLGRLRGPTAASLAARRRLSGSAGVGSTFLTGSGGVRGGSQTLGYSGLLGQ